MLNRFSIRTKLLSAVLAMAVALCCVTGIALWSIYQRMYEDRVSTLKAMVEAGTSLAEKFEAAAAAGQMTRDEAQARFKDALLKMRYSGDEYLFAHTFEQVGFAHPSPKLMGKDVSGIKDAKGVPVIPALLDIVRAKNEGTYAYDWPLRQDDPKTAVKLSYVKGFAPWKIFIGTGVFVDDIWTDFVAMVWKIAGTIALLGLPAIGLIGLVGFSVSRSIRRVSAGMQALADGDLSIDLPEAEQADEVGQMARATKYFRDRMAESEKLRAEQEKLRADTADQRKQDMHRLADDFEHAVGAIIETVSRAAGNLETSADTLTSSADRSQELARTVTAASGEASSNVQSVAAATEELSSSITEISRQVQTSARMAGEAVAQARKTNDRVSELARAASSIGDIVALINGIAAQTNLLALNATIEAARAGDAGRGFAVVASEVKLLAEQTAKATGEISEQVNGMQTATGESVAAIKEIGDTITGLSEIASAIAASVEEQGTATQEISRNVQQAAHGTQQVSSGVSDVQRGASETGAASSQVLSAARSLAADSASLKQKVSAFMTTIRAA
ncbi:cache domain-containing protein [Bradyrhizobium diazoefficiens]|nr:methyl-accepting chemotaxis protein [Bradyrhizobium diazoefficiens]UCF54965.1 MAG: cache domain-containing protein [Bradyrhizobium sp.]MBR0965838.1 cache domain-containing protein [Bradyrhizobium diazoefficiens]MBR0975865.1 cache domain-containing protein [Bradyrhizobium diazoefficiens]MBR1008845.1 cache domain-containing protein [Bradyrhizobium diazoefficiens]MBR1015115.1 cache domain-containing protein [Bradyrhizobium diazoefficiens]